MQQASQDDDFDNDLNDRQPINDNIELPSLQSHHIRARAADY